VFPFASVIGLVAVVPTYVLIRKNYIELLLKYIYLFTIRFRHSVYNVLLHTYCKFGFIRLHVKFPQDIDVTLSFVTVILGLF
jgi:hypothetical protein